MEDFFSQFVVLTVVYNPPIVPTPEIEASDISPHPSEVFHERANIQETYHNQDGGHYENPESSDPHSARSVVRDTLRVGLLPDPHQVVHDVGCCACGEKVHS